MDKLAQLMDSARDELEPAWDEERAARLYVGVGRLRRRRAVTRTVVSTAAAAAVALLALRMGTAPEASEAVAVSQPAPVQQQATAPAVAPEVEEGHRLQLADGSVAQLVGTKSDLQIVHNTTDTVKLRLVAGRANFNVVKRADREFVVQAGDYTVTVVGTIFAAERGEDGLLVAVTEGRVRVQGPEGERFLSAGESALFDGSAVPSAAVRKPARKARPRGTKPSWRSLSRNGDYEAAYAELQQGTQVDNDPAALMDAADSARLSGHPGGAVKYLRRVLDGHVSSPVAPLAAFTLGRVYLERLGQPHKAATAFANARRLAPAGSLAQDALAREVESLSKAGSDSEANLKAKQYVRSYPQGRRLRAVQLYGGLE